VKILSQGAKKGTPKLLTICRGKAEALNPGKSGEDGEGHGPLGHKGDVGMWASGVQARKTG